MVAAVGLLLSDSLSSSLDEDDEDGDDAHRLRVFLPDDSVCRQIGVLKLENDRPNIQDDGSGGMLQQHSQPPVRKCVARAPDVVVLRVAMARDVIFRGNGRILSPCIPPSWRLATAAVVALRAREDEQLMVGNGGKNERMSGSRGGGPRFPDSVIKRELPPRLASFSLSHSLIISAHQAFSLIIRQ